MKPLLLLTTLFLLNSCLSKDQQTLEPAPINTVAVSKTNKENHYDYAGELTTSAVEIPITHSRDHINIQLKPIKRIVPIWDYLEDRLLSRRVSNNRDENCYAKISTFRDFKYENAFIENINNGHIGIKLNNLPLNVQSDYSWNISGDQIEIMINNPHLKGAKLTIENRTIKELFYTKLDLRACAKTEVLKLTRVFEDHKIDRPEYYAFDYVVY